MTKCSGCGDRTAGQVLSPGCTSAKCDRCFGSSTAAAAAAVETKTPRKARSHRPTRKRKRNAG